MLLSFVVCEKDTDGMYVGIFFFQSPRMINPSALNRPASHLAPATTSFYLSIEITRLTES